MPSFPFVNHSWITSVLWSVIYIQLHLGYNGLILFCVLVAIAGVILISKNTLWMIPLLATSYVYTFGVRTYVAPLLFLPVLFFLIDKYTSGYRKYLYAVPVVLLVWANSHGSFLLGLLYIWGYFLVDVLPAKKSLLNKTQVCITFLIASISTIITPYGTGIWVEALRTINNPLLKKYVAEWQPLNSFPSFSLIAIIALWVASVWYTKRVKWIHLFTILLFVASIFTSRIAVLFCVSASFIIANSFVTFKETNKAKIDTQRLSFLNNLLIVLFSILFMIEAFIIWKNRSETIHNFYPVSAVEFLKHHSYSGRIFSIIHWNNYMLLEIPEKPIFIDGRMMVWSQSNKTNELDSTFQTYIDIAILEKPFTDVFDTYCIGTVLWNNAKSNEFWSKNIVSKDLPSRLDKMEWKLTYEDAISVVYERSLPKTCNTTK